MQRAAPGTIRDITRAQVGILARFLVREEAREDHSVAFGGHAAIVVDSGVAGSAIRKQPLASSAQLRLSPNRNHVP